MFRPVSRETASIRINEGRSAVGSINWKWLLIGAALGYAGTVYGPKLLNRG